MGGQAGKYEKLEGEESRKHHWSNLLKKKVPMPGLSGAGDPNETSDCSDHVPLLLNTKIQPTLRSEVEARMDILYSFIDSHKIRSGGDRARYDVLYNL